MNEVTIAPPPPRLSIGERGRFEWERALIGRSGLPPLARLIGLVIALHSGPRGDQGVWLGVPDLQRFTGMTEHSVRRYLALVIDAGWIYAEDRDARRTRALFLAFPIEAS